MVCHHAGPQIPIWLHTLRGVICPWASLLFGGFLPLLFSLPISSGPYTLCKVENPNRWVQQVSPYSVSIERSLYFWSNENSYQQCKTLHWSLWSNQGNDRHPHEHSTRKLTVLILLIFLIFFGELSLSSPDSPGMMLCFLFRSQMNSFRNMPLSKFRLISFYFNPQDPTQLSAKKPANLFHDAHQPSSSQ